MSNIEAIEKWDADKVYYEGAVVERHGKLYSWYHYHEKLRGPRSINANEDPDDWFSLYWDKLSQCDALRLAGRLA